MQNVYIKFLIAFLVLSQNSLLKLGAQAQNTIGLLQFDYENTYPGYNLIYPHNQSDVYLFDNCGRLLHTWPDNFDFRPGNAVYLLENGNIIKTKRYSDFTQDPIWGGGGGAFVDIRTWDNELLYQFERNDSLYRLHHDIQPMPNGNILMILWELKTFEESIQAGRDTAKMAQQKIWSEVVWEWDPIRDTIVWEWSAWDHLVQDHDITRENFGQVAFHPELIDINYDEHDGHPDWLHINAIDYNPVLDQIALSVPYFNEIWIIDHSTTTEEAKGHDGGRWGKGGDLLYRYGNPATYRQGDSNDQNLYFQHHIQWVDTNAELGDPDYGKLVLFNNRIPGGLSAAHIITPFRANSSDYLFQGGRFGPEDFEQTFFHPDTSSLAMSNGLSSVQILSNGNALILSGRWGYAYELNRDSEIVWEYIIPFSAGIPIEQGARLMINDNLTFRLQRFPLDYPAFDDKILSPGNLLELEPRDTLCPIGLVNSTELLKEVEKPQIFPNPNNGIFTIEYDKWQDQHLEIYSMTGQLLSRTRLLGPKMELSSTKLSKGLYLARIGNFVEKMIVH